MPKCAVQTTEKWWNP